MEKNETTSLALVKESLPEMEALLSLNAKPGINVAAVALQELEYLKNISLTKPDILQCIPQSIVAAVKSVLKKNLTLDPDAGLVYIKTRNIPLEKNGDVVTKWGKVLEILESANGLISVARQCGRILDIDRPEIKKDESGKVIGVSVKMLFPSYPEPVWKTISFDEDDFYRWKTFSHRENSRGKKDADNEKFNYANKLYSSWKGGIDPEFARAKAIRHGLKKLGTNPNEALATKIVVETKKVIIDREADEAATNEETTNATVIESTLSKPNNPMSNLPNSSDL